MGEWLWQEVDLSAGAYHGADGFFVDQRRSHQDRNLRVSTDELLNEDMTGHGHRT